MNNRVILCGWWGRGEGRRGCVGKYVYHQKTQTVHKLSNKNASGHKIYPHSERLQETVKQQHDILLLLSISRTIHQKDKCWYSLKKKIPKLLYIIWIWCHLYATTRLKRQLATTKWAVKIVYNVKRQVMYILYMQAYTEKLFKPVKKKSYLSRLCSHCTSMPQEILFYEMLITQHMDKHMSFF